MITEAMNLGRALLAALRELTTEIRELRGQLGDSKPTD